MNKYGYTMVELLAVIAIIRLIFTIGVISYSSLINKSNNTVYEKYRDSMHEAAMTYIMEHPINNDTINLSELILSNRNDYINNPKDNNDRCEKSYINVIRNDINGVINYEYTVCLVCNDYNDETYQNGITGNNCKSYIN